MDYSPFDSPEQWLKVLAVRIGATVENGSLLLDGSADQGTIRLFPLENGLIMILTEARSNVSIPKLQDHLPPDYLFMKLYLPDYNLDTVVKSGFEYYQITTPGVLLCNSRLQLRQYLKSSSDLRSWLMLCMPTGSGRHFLPTPYFQKSDYLICLFLDLKMSRLRYYSPL